MGDFQVTGSRDLDAVARRLREAADGGLRRELLAGIRKSGKKALPDVRDSALHTLPRSGGLNTRVAAQAFAVRTSLAGSSARVSLTGKGMKELRDIDAGNLRHPVWGNRKVWKRQQVTPGFFSNPIRKRAPAIRRDIEQVIHDVNAKIARRF